MRIEILRQNLKVKISYKLRLYRVYKIKPQLKKNLKMKVSLELIRRKWCRKIRRISTRINQFQNYNNLKSRWKKSRNL